MAAVVLDIYIQQSLVSDSLNFGLLKDISLLGNIIESIECSFAWNIFNLCYSYCKEAEISLCYEMIPFKMDTRHAWPVFVFKKIKWTNIYSVIR